MFFFFSPFGTPEGTVRHSFLFSRHSVEKIDSLFGRYRRRQRVKAYRVGTLLLRSFAHPMELAAATIHPLPLFPHRARPTRSTPIRTASARARAPLRFSLFRLPSRGWQFLRHDYPRNLSSANARTVFPAVRPMLAYLEGGQARTHAGAAARARAPAGGREVVCIYKCDLPHLGGRGQVGKIGGWTVTRTRAYYDTETEGNIWVKVYTSW